ncbi:uncharacterized protein NEMAJ01_1588 [Nematocida major]|uniref:uncharacterized protein n=1 Tax=Nematocida major TaxID=1912982 RepID=UPI002008B1F4|nr:uncharacterized protein NEMAJ01_1588 [Nematocida major]KAH9386692.1 hypothetical protein NEMAJ01_1588 [Nematocida major]
MAHKGKLHKNERSRESERKENRHAPKYYRGEKQAPAPKPRLTRNVVNKTFRTDGELTEFILNEGTFKDKVAAMTLMTIQEQDGKALNQLMSLLESSEGGDKVYLAITHAVKIADYYLECKKEAENPAADTESTPDARKFCLFIEKSLFVKRLTEGISKHMASPFLKEKLMILVKNMVETDTLSEQMVGIMLDAADVQVDKEILLIFSHIIKHRKMELISILRDKITQTIVSHRNPKKVKYFVTLALLLNKSEWVQEDADYTAYVVPLIRGFMSLLKTVQEEIGNPQIKAKTSASVLSSLLKGLLRFINWQKTIPSLKMCYTSEILKEVGYIIFKLAYNDNTRYSLPALNLLETANETEKINYSRVLGDTIRKYIYLNDLSKCEILNKAVNMPAQEVQVKVVQSAYHAPIGSKYPLGCMMVTQEAGQSLKNRAGYVLLSQSHDPELADTAEKLVRGESISVYNIWS